MALSIEREFMASTQQLLQAFDSLLQPERFKDYGPNGLQVEGKGDVSRIISGVTNPPAKAARMTSTATRRVRVERRLADILPAE